jgi:hypothetical protein
MSQGYSLRLVEQNAKADVRKLGVRLGRACIVHDIPVAVVAEQFSVTRQTIYNWFRGGSTPSLGLSSAVELFINSLS